jgi:hypothetical protein
MLDLMFLLMVNFSDYQQEYLVFIYSYQIIKIAYVLISRRIMV